MSIVSTNEGMQIYYKGWRTGKSVVFSHNWSLNTDSWEAQKMFLASTSYRCIAHGRCGHGRSSQTQLNIDLMPFLKT